MSSTTGFPQPTRPDNSYSPVTAYPVPPQLIVPEPVGYPVQITNRDGYYEEAADERESIDELKRGIMELYQKLPESIRREVNLNKFHIPNDVVSDLKGDDARSRELRGIVDQLSPKLERFKVRTVRGGVVTVDNNDDGDKT